MLDCALKMSHRSRPRRMKCWSLRTFLCISTLAIILIFSLHLSLRLNECSRLNPKRQEESENGSDADEADDRFQKRVHSKIQPYQKSQNVRADVSQVDGHPSNRNLTKTAAKFTKPAKSDKKLQPATSACKRLDNRKEFLKKPYFQKVTRPRPTQTPRWVWNFTNIISANHKFPTSRKQLRIRDFTADPIWEMDHYYTLDTLSTQTSCPMSVKIKVINSQWLKEIFLPQITIFMDSRHFSDKEWERLEHFAPPYGWMALNYAGLHGDKRHPVGPPYERSPAGASLQKWWNTRNYLYQVNRCTQPEEGLCRPLQCGIKDVKEVVSALPQLTEQQILLSAKVVAGPHCVRCAVVATGGILNGSRLGKEIDMHDYVFRVNGAVTKGFETDVGTRTSFYGFTAKTLISSLFVLENQGFTEIPRAAETKYILYPEGQIDYEWLEAVQKNKEISKGLLTLYRKPPRDDFGKSFNDSKLLVAHPDFMRYLKDRFLRSNTLNGKYWNIYRPSTGALVLLTAIHLCDTVSAYGFITDDYESFSAHYYDKNKKEMTFYINHDFLLERNLWRNLHQENIIKLYRRT